jgi:hypothetical protein
MKTFATCMQCQIELGRPSFEAFIADYFDEGIAFIECSAGHKTALVMQAQKFEMLLDSGAAALLEGFTLEACASIAAALERFYEFSLRVACVGRKMPDELYITRCFQKWLGNRSVNLGLSCFCTLWNSEAPISKRTALQLFETR